MKPIGIPSGWEEVIAWFATTLCDFKDCNVDVYSGYPQWQLCSHDWRVEG